MSDAIGNRRWWTLGLFFLCYTVLYMARASVSMAGPSMIAFYGWSKTEFGLVSTAFFLGYASTMVLGGVLADKFGGGRVLCVAAVLWSVFVFITPLPLGVPLVLMIVVRAGCGMAQGVALPSMEDMDATGSIARALGLVKIHLLDHFILTDTEYFSMRDANRLPIFDFKTGTLFWP